MRYLRGITRRVPSPRQIMWGGAGGKQEGGKVGGLLWQGMKAQLVAKWQRAFWPAGAKGTFSACLGDRHRGWGESEIPEGTAGLCSASRADAGTSDCVLTSPPSFLTLSQLLDTSAQARSCCGFYPSSRTQLQVCCGCWGPRDPFLGGGTAGTPALFLGAGLPACSSHGFLLSSMRENTP